MDVFNVLKDILAKLDEPVCTFDHFNDFIKLRKFKQDQVKNTISSLPAINRDTMIWITILIAFLS